MKEPHGSPVDDQDFSETSITLTDVNSSLSSVGKGRLRMRTFRSKGADNVSSVPTAIRIPAKLSGRGKERAPRDLTPSSRQRLKALAESFLCRVKPATGSSNANETSEAPATTISRSSSLKDLKSHDTSVPVPPPLTPQLRRRSSVDRGLLSECPTSPGTPRRRIPERVSAEYLARPRKRFTSLQDAVDEFEKITSTEPCLSAIKL